jgi:predicted DsbA family dithiol-disulfide isomerase
VLEFAKGVGVDEGAFTTCYTSAETTNALNKSIANGSNLFNINGTPGNVVLNRETGEYILIEGAYPASEFENAVNQLLS